MARTKKTNEVAKVTTNHSCSCHIVGELTDVYEGKTANYLTIKVNRDEVNPKTKEPYYNLYKVNAAKDIELYDDGTIIEVSGTIATFFDKEINRTTMYIVADTVRPVSNE